MVAEARAIGQLPSDIDRLVDAAHEEGHNLVARLVDEWRDGSNRFDRPGEVLAEARCRGVLCGIGGLNVDPYLEDPSVGRIRHVYVEPQRRREGVGRVLIDFLVDRAMDHFDRVRLRSVQWPGPDFYGSLGFTETHEAEATHTKTLEGHTPAG